MNTRLSKQARIIVIVNCVLIVLLSMYHIYNAYQIKTTADKIDVVMVERSVSRELAIDILEKSGEDLFLGNEFSTYFGLLMILVSSFVLYQFSLKNGFFLGILAGFCLLFTTFIGGFLLFYIILSGKSQNDELKAKYALRNDWEKFIHNRV